MHAYAAQPVLHTHQLDNVAMIDAAVNGNLALNLKKVELRQPYLVVCFERNRRA
jgi:hypothetical protein